MDDPIERLIKKHDSASNQQLVANLEGMYNYHNNVQSSNVTPCHLFDFEVSYIGYNSEEYKVWKANYYDACLKFLSLDPRNETIMATILHNMISTHVLASDACIWYYLNNTWVTDQGQYLWNIITKDFPSYLSSSDHVLGETLSHISKVSVRNNLYNDIKKRLYYPDIALKMNSIQGIIGVKNGTLDINTGQVRESQNTDFISLSTETIYDSLPDASELGLLYRILSQVFPYEELFAFFIRSCSTFIEGCNSTKHLFVWWGTGNNAKTGMQTLVQSALGKYCGTAPVSMITAKRGGSSNATPELTHIENKLVVFLQEPNQREELKTGRIKELTGNDRIFIRGLYERNAREMSVKCKLVLVVNYPNVGQNTDSAFKRRVLVVPFESTFLSDDEFQDKLSKNILQPNTFPIDERVEKLFVALGPVFLHVMVQEYQKFRVEGLPIPSIIKQKTQEFLTYNNYCLKYIKRYLHRQEPHPEEQGIDSNTVYELFKIWIRDMFPGKAIPNSEAFCKELVDEGFVENEQGVIYGIRIDQHDVKTQF